MVREDAEDGGGVSEDAEPSEYPDIPLGAVAGCRGIAIFAGGLRPARLGPRQVQDAGVRVPPGSAGAGADGTRPGGGTVGHGEKEKEGGNAHGA